MAIVAAIFLVCLLPGQLLIANLLPGVAGLAKIKTSLIIQDISAPMPAAIDLIVVPGLFIILYVIVLLIYSSRRGMSLWSEIAQRLWAVFLGSLILLFCVAAGGLISYLVQDHLPKKIRTGVDSFGINAEINLPFSGYRSVHLHGNVIPLVCLVIGIVLCIWKIKRAPVIRKTLKLTREQRMTPYQRMLREKRELEKTTKEPIRQPAAANGSSLLCHSQPLPTIRPEAVNYRPLL